MKSPRPQRGAVVLIAMLIVALAATAAVTLLQQQHLAMRQLEVARDYEQARWILKGGVQWARAILAQDSRVTTLDHAGELWATGLPATEIEQGAVSGEIRDQQGLFNLNNLVLDGKQSARDLAAFRKLLQAVGLRGDLADAIADWVDTDRDAVLPDGAEDEHYLRLPAPYRTANQPMSDFGELARVRGGDEATLAVLRRVATVLPQRTAININLAPPEVLAAVVNGLTLAEAHALAGGRAAAPIRSLEDFRARLPKRGNVQVIDEMVSVESQFFVVEGRAKVGGTDVRMAALLMRDKGAPPVILWQRTQ